MKDIPHTDIGGLMLLPFNASDVEFGRTLCGKLFFDAAPKHIAPPLISDPGSYLGREPRLWRVYAALPEETSRKILHMHGDCGFLWVSCGLWRFNQT